MPGARNGGCKPPQTCSRREGAFMVYDYSATLEGFLSGAGSACSCVASPARSGGRAMNFEQDLLRAS